MIHPSLSVCIPVYNGAAFVAEAVESVLAQTFHDFELIVLDNASTDGTLQRLERFDDKRLRIIRHASNIGAAANFNAALQEASGEWVKILCADDLLYPDCLQQQLAEVESHLESPPVLFSCARDIIDDNGRRWMRRSFQKVEGRVAGAKAIHRSACAGTNLLGEPGAVLMHRETALKVGGFDPACCFCIDLDLWDRILQHGDLYVDPVVRCAFRVSTNSWSASLGHSQAKEFSDWLVGRQREGVLSLSRAEMFVGRVRAYLLMAQRWVFYKIVHLFRKV